MPFTDVLMKQLCALIVCSGLAAPVAAQPGSDARAGSIGGRVIRPDGIPQPEAAVLAATRGADGRLRASPWRTRTAFDGRYEIAGVPAGRYLVLVRVVGSDAPMQGRPLATLFPGVATTEPGTAVEVLPGVPLEGVDIWLLPSPRRFQVAGRVVDHLGRDLEHVSIEFGPPRGRADHVWTVTEPGGLFTMSGVSPGPVVLRVRADGPSGPLIGLASTELAIESVQDLRVVVRDPGRVRVRVRAPGGTALPESVRLSLVPTILRPSALYPPEPVAPDAEGRFELAGGPGEHDIRVEGVTLNWCVRRVEREFVTNGPPAVWLTPGGTVEDVLVEIGPAPGSSRSAR